MEINKTFKTAQGTVTFKGELSQEEADYVIQIGLNTLLQQGAIPFQVVQDNPFDDVEFSEDDEEGEEEDDDETDPNLYS